jgi:hypothetical protein
MNIIRDALWHACLTDAVNMYQVGEADEKCVHLANATWVMKNRYTQAQKRKDHRKTIMIEKTPEVVNEQRTSKKICQAITMSSKPCSFRAVCGNFCRKHRVEIKISS